MRLLGRPGVIRVLHDVGKQASALGFTPLTSS